MNVALDSDSNPVTIGLSHAQNGFDPDDLSYHMIELYALLTRTRRFIKSIICMIIEKRARCEVV